MVDVNIVVLMAVDCIQIMCAGHKTVTLHNDDDFAKTTFLTNYYGRATLAEGNNPVFTVNTVDHVLEGVA